MRALTVPAPEPRQAVLRTVPPSIAQAVKLVAPLPRERVYRDDDPPPYARPDRYSYEERPGHAAPCVAREVVRDGGLLGDDELLSHSGRSWGAHPPAARRAG
mgnify:CR=1 FL=1